ncbi:MAG: TonB-dependent receptor domain-containing protein [Chitinophagaceae bacterium]
MKKISLLAVFIYSSSFIIAQVPTAAPNKRFGAGSQLNIGHFYGKVIDSKTNKGLDAASVQLTGNKFDTAAKKMKQVILATVLTQSNGDFSLENLPVFGNFMLLISSVGYKNYQQQISFGLKFPQRNNNNSADNSSANNDNNSGQDRMQQMMGMVDKDLGNIKLEADASSLANVTVTASKPFFEMGVDRKVFNVDKNIVTTGQTATEVMRQIPTLNVDIDGNVTLRNATPQLFVDGRPTTLTMDQIPADIIDRVELITNPSAKFDASGGNGGIINIVLKKNIKKGYNGGIRAGVDTRGRFNVGGDFNFRQNKINFFANGNFNQRKSISTSTTNRDIFTDPVNQIYQTGTGTNKGSFQFFRAGFDYFIDNRNTITVSGNIVHGNFNNNQPQLTDSIINSEVVSQNNVNSVSTFDFKNYGGQLSFKHNFAKNNHDITADFNYNSSNNTNNSDINTYNTKFAPSLLKTLGTGYNRFITVQSDYENPVTENTKFEAGVRAAIRNYRSDNNKYLFDDSTGDYVVLPGISNSYKYTDEVFAAYSTYTIKGKIWNYQLGLRAESSNYNGTSLVNDSSFKINYPLSLFPSAFITYKVADRQDLSVNYTRRINRPNFFQLTPIYDYSDPQNPTKGNAGLKPEFTNSLEVSYNNTYKKGGNFLATIFFKYSTDLITRYYYQAFNPVTDTTSFFSTYINANNSIIYGLELTNKINVFKPWELTLNVNLFDSKINADSVKIASSNERVSWFAKMNNNIKLPKSFTIQFSGDYQAKTVLPPSSGGGGFGGGYGGGNIGSSQGYINPRYGFDMAIKKEWTWKKGNIASLTLSMTDIFRTELYSTYSVISNAPLVTQTIERRRDPQILRLNFSYRFGKFDVSLFKRKDTKSDQNIDINSMPGQQ